MFVFTVLLHLLTSLHASDTCPRLYKGINLQSQYVTVKQYVEGNNVDMFEAYQYRSGISEFECDLDLYIEVGYFVVCLCYK